MSTVIHAALITTSLLAADFCVAESCRFAFGSRGLSPTVQKSKAKMKAVRPKPDRASGVVQLTGKNLLVGQKTFPMRTPADPIVFEDARTGEIFVYGTQVDGTGFSYLKYPNRFEMYRGVEPEIVSRNVYLPNGQLARGKEAIWDTYRLSYAVLAKVFGDARLAEFYGRNGIDAGADLYFGGIALQPDGNLGRWTTDNWRRRIHVIAPRSGELQIVKDPVFNPIANKATENDYPGFGRLPFLPGNYVGHAYGANFKVVMVRGEAQLWVINEEVTRRVQVGGALAEVTEIVARRMVTPFQASGERIVLVSVNGKDGRPHPATDRGPEMGHTKLLEGFRPMSVTPELLRISKREMIVGGKSRLVKDLSLMSKEYSVLTGSQGNFAGDGYDVLVAVREGGLLGRHEIIETEAGDWQKFIADIKLDNDLSWAGRASFDFYDGQWWLLFHGVDKSIRPDGSYGGVIPPDTEAYHRNIYAVPVDFYISASGKVKMRVLAKGRR